MFISQLLLTPYYTTYRKKGKVFEKKQNLVGRAIFIEMFNFINMSLSWFLFWYIVPFLVFLLLYLIALEIWKSRHEQELRRQPIATSVTKLQIDKFRRDVNRRFRLGLSTSNAFLVVTNLILAFMSLATFSQTTETNETLNRPYINVDASQMTEQLKVFHGDPDITVEKIISNVPMPYNNSFSFKIENLGKLPAQYRADVTGFKRNGLERILAPGNAAGFIFPGQIIELKYDLKGHSNSTSSYSDMERLFLLAEGDLSKAGAIILHYSYLDKVNSDFQTRIEERIVERNCDRVPTPMINCHANPVWTTVTAN